MFHTTTEPGLWEEIHSDLIDDPVGAEIIGMFLRERWANMDRDALRDVTGVAPATDDKEELRRSGIGKWDELVLRWIEDPDGLGPLWTGEQLRERLQIEARNDRALSSMGMGQLSSKLREHGCWKPYAHADRDGRIGGIGKTSRYRDVLWALYETDDLKRTDEKPKEELRDMLIEQHANRGVNIAPLNAKAAKDAKDVLDDDDKTKKGGGGD